MIKIILINFRNNEVASKLTNNFDYCDGLIYKGIHYTFYQRTGSATINYIYKEDVEIYGAKYQRF